MDIKKGYLRVLTKAFDLDGGRSVTGTPLELRQTNVDTTNVGHHCTVAVDNRC